MQLDLKIKIIGFFYCFALTDMFSLILLKKIIMHFNCGYIKFAGVKKKRFLLILFRFLKPFVCRGICLFGDVIGV